MRSTFETTEQRRIRTVAQNRVYFEASLDNKDMIDIREYLPSSHLMSTMMRQDRDYLIEFHPELVLKHMSTPYFEGDIDV